MRLAMPEVQIDGVGESLAKPSTASAHKWLYRGLGSAASGLEYRHNKEREVLSLKGPTPADEALNAQLLDELRRNGAYEDDAKDAVRESALHSVETVLSQWVVAQSEKVGQPVEPGEACKIHGRFGVTCAAEDAAAFGAQREDVAGLHEVGLGSFWIRENGDGFRAVLRRDARGNSVRRVHRNREVGAEAFPVVADHALQAELLGPLLGDRRADEAAPVRRHEVDRLW